MGQKPGPHRRRGRYNWQLLTAMLPMPGAPNRTGGTEATPPARVFIGLKVAPEIADELARLAKSIEQPSVRLIAPADIHLTLVPPWNEPSIPEATEKLRRVTGRFAAFRLTFEHVGYGPQKRRPRLLWVSCAAGDEIARLHAALREAFGERDERPFQPHVTIARMREKGFAIARRHPIDQPLSLRQRVETVELFQSPPPGASGYRVLASLRLGAASDP